ncbi:aminodeoxychorismate lyase [Ectobacillus ponti]|uniref:Aminodeoxychorismate lyase n=1 Tax=Ectobacillus ponti TaxID=2961894 RepID=A0AA41X930_9BACI|nr:aminodeoxychorismate lyase [Ectobacillus ponti]MCP8971159.1 aminodeoxychorismate lyase [Ectobacillus ponti]
MLIYLNGEVLPAAEARISPYDHGFLYGLGVFETFRTYDGHPFLLHDHFERLMAALSALQIRLGMTREQMGEIVGMLLEANGLQDAYIRFNVSAGSGEVGLQTDAYEQPTVIVFVKPLPPAGTGMAEKEGILLEQRRNTPEGEFRLKSHHYLNSILGKREAGPGLQREGLFLTGEGHVAEGVTSNIFFVKEGVLCTPSLDTGILNGITRELVLALAAKLGIRTEVGLFRPEQLLGAEEIFVTNSVQEIVPLSSVQQISFPGKDGRITRALFQEYIKHRHTLWSKQDL